MRDDDRGLPQESGEADDCVSPALRGSEPGGRGDGPKGRIGEPILHFGLLDARASRATSGPKPELGGGTLYDIGIYCINAARYLFRDEPVEVFAFSVNQNGAPVRTRSTNPLRRCSDFPAASAWRRSCQLRRGRRRRLPLVGTKGQLRVDPAYEYAEGLAYSLTISTAR